MQSAWAFVIVFAALILELWCGAARLPLPWLAAATLYVGTTNRGASGAAAPLAAGVLLDVTLGRGFPVTAALVVPAVLWLAAAWRRYGVCGLRIAQAAPGAAAGLIQALFTLAVVALPAEPLTTTFVFRAGVGVAAAAAAGALLLPLLCLALDPLARRLALPLYRDIQQRRAPPYAA
jgi:hypothetical protein